MADELEIGYLIHEMKTALDGTRVVPWAIGSMTYDVAIKMSRVAQRTPGFQPLADMCAEVSRVINRKDQEIKELKEKLKAYDQSQQQT